MSRYACLNCGMQLDGENEIPRMAFSERLKKHVFWIPTFHTVWVASSVVDNLAECVSASSHKWLWFWARHDRSGCNQGGS